MLLNTIFPVATPGIANGMGFDTRGTTEPGFVQTATTNRSSGRAARSAADRGPDAGGPWIACDEAGGVVEVHDPRVLRRGHEAFCRELVRAAVVRFGVKRAEVFLETATCRLEFGPGLIDREEMARRVASAVKVATPAIRQGAGGPDRREGLSRVAAVDGPSGPGDVASIADEFSLVDDAYEAPRRRRRLVHLAMAGGSLTLAAAAVILPGLPTLPFLVMTSRHAAMASDRVERMLKRHPWCAALLEEEAPGSAIEWGSLLKMLALGILFAVGIWIFQPPLPVVLGLELGLMLFLGLREWFGSDLAEIGLEVVA